MKKEFIPTTGTHFYIFEGDEKIVDAMVLWACLDQSHDIEMGYSGDMQHFVIMDRLNPKQQLSR